MSSQKDRSKQADRITRCAIDRYGELRGRKVRPALDQLVLGLMCTVTSVRQATRALRALKREFAGWNEVRVSHPIEVAAAISSARWALEAAEKLVWLLGETFETYNRTDLGFLAELTPAQARSCLVRLPVVERPLADEVLLFSLGVQVLPMSQAVARMCHRLGLLDDERPTLKNQRALSKLFDAQYFPCLHLFFCDHAAKLCLPEEPICKRCPMRRHCRYAK